MRTAPDQRNVETLRSSIGCSDNVDTSSWQKFQPTERVSSSRSFQPLREEKKKEMAGLTSKTVAIGMSHGHWAEYKVIQRKEGGKGI